MRADAVKNRRRILDAAEEVFATEGVSVPVDVVAERAGVGVGTLYRHFPTKEALFEAIVVTKIDSLVALAADALDADRHEDPGKVLFDYLRQLGRQATEKHDLLDALAAAGIDVEPRCADKMAELKRAVGVLVDRAAEAGAVRDDVTAPEVLGLVVGVCSAAGRPGQAGVSADRLIEIVCDGLRPV
jgi:AcrR family transcriptional regulator